MHHCVGNSSHGTYGYEEQLTLVSVSSCF